jgi:predicted choloylglycine hydrolase
LRTLTEQCFPQIHEELLGLAAGLDLPAEDVFLWNCRGDLWSMSPDGCTTVQLPSRQGPRITHNEDGDPGFAGYCGLGLFAPADGPAFASFVYPASIPGHTFAVNEHGLAMTVNNLRSRQISPGVPRMVLTRAILGKATVEDGLNVLRNNAKAGGFHLSLVQRGMPDLTSVEFNAMGVSVQVIEHAAVHANHVIHAEMRDFPQLITDSSRCRQERATELLNGASTDPLTILTDQRDKKFPIFRTAADDSDNENTMATADIHARADHVAWEVYERPTVSSRYTLVDAKLA